MGWLSRLRTFLGQRKEKSPPIDGLDSGVTSASTPVPEKMTEPVKMDERVTVIVPAHNEENYIRNVITPLLEWQRADPAKRHFVVVDDGSTDKTVEIAMRMGAEVIYSDPKTKRNKGKAQAFIIGARYAKEHGSKYFVTLDADLYDLKPQQVDKLVIDLKNSKVDMMIGWHREAGQFGAVYGGKEHQIVSGQRAFRMEALEPLLRNNPKWFSLFRGWYEPALNYLIPKHDVTRNVVFCSAPAHRTPDSRRSQERDFLRAARIVRARHALAKKIFDKRKAGKRDEAIRLREAIRGWEERMQQHHRK